MIRDDGVRVLYHRRAGLARNQWVLLGLRIRLATTWDSFVLRSRSSISTVADPAAPSQTRWWTLVVFAEPGDMVLLGAHSLEGMNLRIDLAKKELVPAGPIITAAA